MKSGTIEDCTFGFEMLSGWCVGGVISYVRAARSKKVPPGVMIFLAVLVEGMACISIKTITNTSLEHYQLT